MAPWTQQANLRGPAGTDAQQRTFIQPDPPTATGPYLWWDTSDGDLTLWIEDGS